MHTIKKSFISSLFFQFCLLPPPPHPPPRHGGDIYRYKCSNGSFTLEIERICGLVDVVCKKVKEGCTDFFVPLVLLFVIVAGRNTLLHITSTGRKKCSRSLLTSLSTIFLLFNSTPTPPPFGWRRIILPGIHLIHDASDTQHICTWLIYYTRILTASFMLDGVRHSPCSHQTLY